jgi:hypothetical protein
LTDILNNYDLLDPSREIRDVDAALGSHIFDKWSELDPELFARRFNALKPNVLGTLEALDPYRRLLAINAASAGYFAFANLLLGLDQLTLGSDHLVLGT